MAVFGPQGVCNIYGAATVSTSRWQLLPAFFLPPPPSSFERVGRCPDSDRAALSSWAPCRVAALLPPVRRTAFRRLSLRCCRASGRTPLLCRLSRCSVPQPPMISAEALANSCPGPGHIQTRMRWRLTPVPGGCCPGRRQSRTSSLSDGNCHGNGHCNCLGDGHTDCSLMLS